MGGVGVGEGRGQNHTDVMGQTELVEGLRLSEKVTGRDAYAKSQYQDYSYPLHQCGFPPKMSMCQGGWGQGVVVCGMEIQTP